MITRLISISLNTVLKGETMKYKDDRINELLQIESAKDLTCNPYKVFIAWMVDRGDYSATTTQLADRTGITLRNVSRAVAVLIAKGWLCTPKNGMKRYKVDGKFASRHILAFGPTAMRIIAGVVTTRSTESTTQLNPTPPSLEALIPAVDPDDVIIKSWPDQSYIKHCRWALDMDDQSIARHLCAIKQKELQ